MRDNNKVKSIDSNHPSILSEKTNNSYLLFSYYNANPHICKLYNFQHKSNSKSKASYCKACNNDKHYLIQLHKVAYLKKNVDNKLCIDLRKKFDKIAKLEERYKRELDEQIQFKELLKKAQADGNPYFNKFTVPIVPLDYGELKNYHRIEKIAKLSISIAAP